MTTNNSNSHETKTKIIVAVITVIGTLGAAAIALTGTLGAAIISNTKIDSPPTSVPPALKTVVEDLEVHADDTKGTPFKNRENQYIQVQFEANANDTWLAIPEDVDVPEYAKGYLSARGAMDFESNTTPCRVPVGALIVVGENSECKASGENGTFELAPGETAYFLMNDVDGLYEDNKNSINVKVQVSENSM